MATTYLALRQFELSAKHYNLYFNERSHLAAKNETYMIEDQLIQYDIFTDSIQKEKLLLEKQLIDAEYKNKQLKNDKIQFSLNVTLLISSLIILFLMLLFLINKKRLEETKKHEAVLKLQNEELIRTLVSKEEKEILLKEIHHRVKNNLQIISSLIRLQAGYIDESNFREKLVETENRIRSMALIHERLYQTGNLASLGIREYVKELAIQISETYQNQTKIEYEFNIEKRDFSIDSLIPIGLILNETISNALKHAFKNTKEGKIRISLNSIRDETHFIIRDNGIGSNKKLDELANESLGIELIIALVDQLDGQLKIDTINGFAYTFIFPRLF
jgi:two-component sensor histidine kinase